LVGVYRGDSGIPEPDESALLKDVWLPVLSIGSAHKKVVTMLAEIFMMRLESAPRPSQEKLPSSTSQFVSFNGSGQFRFKDRKDQRIESTPQKAESTLHV
jgi:hypothetical protein